jgi:acetoin utilization deacetylase AcuC-like enzyme
MHAEFEQKFFEPKYPCMEVVVVSASSDALVEGHTGLLGNKPEERKRLVLTALQNAGATCVFAEKVEETLKLAELVHDKAMLSFFEHAWREWETCVHATSQDNSFILNVFGDLGDVPAAQWGSNRPVPPFVCKFGSAARHDGVQQTGTSVLSKIAFYCVHAFTPICESTLPSLKWDLAVTKRAVDVVLSGVARVAYAQVIHPGHHAGPGSYGGFCFINSAAIAARMLQQKYDKVAVIDVDYHHGNGTMAVFWDDPTVLFASLHGDPNYEFPFTSGFANQVGGHGAEHTTINVVLPVGCPWSEYAKELQQILYQVEVFGASAMVVSLGLDTLKGDPVTFPQARVALDLNDFREMGQMLLGLNLPTVVVQEGGYLLDQVPTAVLNFFDGKKI